MKRILSFGTLVAALWGIAKLWPGRQTNASANRNSDNSSRSRNRSRRTTGRNRTSARKRSATAAVTVGTSQ